MPIRWMTVFVDLPASAFDDVTAFWLELTGSTLSPARGADGEFATVLPPDGDAYLRVQQIGPDGAGHPGRGGVHLDLHLDPLTESVDRTAARAISLGATVRHHQDGLIVLESPGGFPFCLVSWDGEMTIPSPVELDPTQHRAHSVGPDRRAGGGPNRLDQLCLDIPPELHQRECSFWAAFTGWQQHPAGLEEFSYLERIDGMPIRLMFQRRDQAGPGDRVTGHLDFACADATALAERQVLAGATLVADLPYWVSMRDPAGRAYCLTRRTPFPPDPIKVAGDRDGDGDGDGDGVK